MCGCVRPDDDDDDDDSASLKSVNGNTVPSVRWERNFLSTVIWMIFSSKLLNCNFSFVLKFIRFFNWSSGVML
jgi:hypothetical protein